MRSRRSGEEDPESAALRDRAAARLGERAPSPAAPPTPEQALRLVHEMQVHREELELQNAELRETRSRLQDSLRDYSDLFDFAPIGYCVLDPRGTILRANLAAAALLGVPRAQLTGRRLAPFVAPESRGDFRSFLEGTLSGDDRQSCQVALSARGPSAGSRRSQLRLEGQGSLAEGERRCLVALLDITELRRQEEEGRALNADLERRVAERTGELQLQIADRRAAEGRLREAEERLRFALEATSDGLWDWNLATGESYCNAAYLRMLGYDPADLPATAQGRWIDLLHPDDRDATVTAAKRALASVGRYQLEFRLRAKDGRYKWVLSRGKVVARNGRGEPLRAVGTHSDIDERRRLAEALRRSESRLRSILEGTADAVYVKDLEGRYLLLNRGAAALMALDVQDVIGRDDSRLFPAEEASALMALDRRVLAEDQVVTSEETLTTADGIRRAFLTTKGPLRDDTGEVYGLFGISREITSLLQKEEAQRQALEESRHLLELALAGAGLGTWDVDLTSGACRYDTRYCAMLGYRPEELEPTMEASQRLIHPDDLATVREAIRAHLNGETHRYAVEHRMRHKEGHWIWIAARGKASFDAEVRPVRATGTILDITDRKRVATEGAELLRRIEALIAGLDRRWEPEAVPSIEGQTQGQVQARLSTRNREVLGLLAKGLTAAEIADRLGISKETAMTHRRNLMRKLALRNKAELIRYAIEHRIEAAD